MDSDELILRINSDSKYLLCGIETWTNSWEKRGWKKFNNKKVLNLDLWKEIHDLKSSFHLEFKYIEGHSGHPENELCDQLAVEMIEKHRKDNK